MRRLSAPLWLTVCGLGYAMACNVQPADDGDPTPKVGGPISDFPVSDPGGPGTVPVPPNNPPPGPVGDGEPSVPSDVPSLDAGASSPASSMDAAQGYPPSSADSGVPTGPAGGDAAPGPVDDGGAADGGACDDLRIPIADAGMAAGACSSSAALALACEGQLRRSSALCAREHALSLSPARAIRACVLDEPVLASAEESCRACYVDETTCTLANCLAFCAGGLEEACSDCRRARCGAPFSACSGLTRP